MCPCFQVFELLAAAKTVIKTKGKVSFSETQWKVISCAEATSTVIRLILS
jgi:hypothetical protein